jgi:hypothetical protein
MPEILMYALRPKVEGKRYEKYRIPSGIAEPGHDKPHIK